MLKREVHLAGFILTHMELILEHWEAFAATQLPAAAVMSSLALRDHARQILEAVALDLTTAQSSKTQAEKSMGLVMSAAGAPATAAQTHALLRAMSGFNISQLAAEYRALRASVLSLWLQENPPETLDLQDVIRFNEAIDQALAESIECFSARLTQQRNLFLGIVGHDLRNPLQSIQVTAQYLSALNANTEVSKAARILINSGARMKALLDDLVDFNRSRLGVGLYIRSAPADMEQLFREELEQLRIAFPGKVFELEVKGFTSGVWDSFRLKQVLSNLVTNAIKYGDPSAPVSVRVAGAADTVHFEVENAGPAIDPAILDQIFDPLVRGDDQDRSQTEGLGLGLFIVQQIVKAHGGEIKAESGNNRTVFTVQIPRNSPASR